MIIDDFRRSRVSVVVTCHNRQEVILRAVNSIVNQTYKNIEIIVVDDFSTDNSTKILEDSSLDFILVKHSRNKGQNAALNTGFGVATGEYLSYLDSDDWWDPQFIEYSLRELKRGESDSGIDFVFSFPKKNVNRRFLKESSPESVCEGYKIALENLGLGRSGTFLFHKRCVEKSELFPNQGIYAHSQDNLMGLRLAQNWRFRILDYELLNTDVSGNALTFQYGLTARSLRNLLLEFSLDLRKYCESSIELKHLGYIARKYLLANEFSEMISVLRDMMALVQKPQDLYHFVKVVLLNVLMYVREKLGTATVVKLIK